MFATPGQNYLLISDAPGPQGGIMLQFGGPAGPYIKVSATGVEMGMSPAAPAITVTAAGIDLGNGALHVTTG